MDWEVFGAILTGDQKRVGYGSDLTQLEVKSAVAGNSFEYQYHKEHGEEKLNEDPQIDHLFISYSKDYTSLVVRYVEAARLAPVFESWRQGYQERYASGGQRFRKSISFGFVVEHSEVILRVVDGLQVYPTEISR
ncbi:hypothetical protein [Armatimonas sp.]|uniref:hypothetical protein n=1 Tax=Armatimonas sp. TaxID=1872638 RepID=UPI00286C874C|nr:hypothetical protein [Armatimonas sp.]